MKVAITGGTGFVGRHLAERLLEHGHEVVVLGRRGRAGRDDVPSQGTFLRVDSDDLDGLRAAFLACTAAAHCAGINRELGTQTCAAVHLEGTRDVVEAARAAGIERLVMLCPTDSPPISRLVFESWGRASTSVNHHCP